MARKPTTYSRVSSGWKDSKNTLKESGYDLGFFDSIGTNLTLSGTLTGAAYTGTTAAFTSTLSANGAATLQSTLTVRGQTTADGGIAVGGGANVVAISTATAAISFGAIVKLGTSSLKTVGLSGATRGDQILITPDSLWQDTANNRLISYFASSSSTAGEVNVWALNSSQTDITPTASTVFRLTRLNFASYL